MAAGSSMTSLWPVNIGMGDVGRGGVRRDLVADEATRKRIARGLDLLSLNSLEATIGVSPWLDGVEITGRWKASLTQACVVNLDPLSTDLAGEFLIRLVPPGSDALPSTDSEVVLDPEGEDPPDVMEGDRIDIGHYVVEHLALEIDPFPRTPGVEFVAPEATEPESPFAVLRRLKDDGE